MPSSNQKMAQALRAVAQIGLWGCLFYCQDNLIIPENINN
jgi:hypothetical protein